MTNTLPTTLNTSLFCNGFVLLWRSGSIQIADFWLFSRTGSDFYWALAREDGRLLNLVLYMYRYGTRVRTYWHSTHFFFKKIRTRVPIRVGTASGSCWIYYSGGVLLNLALLWTSTGTNTTWPHSTIWTGVVLGTDLDTTVPSGIRCLEFLVGKRGSSFRIHDPLNVSSHASVQYS